MTLPSINIIRSRLADVENALVDEPDTKTVDLGDAPCAPIFQPEDQKYSDIVDPSDESNTAPPDEEPPIVFEIPPGFDERDLKALGQSSGTEYERLVEVNGTDALAWYYP